MKCKNTECTNEISNKRIYCSLKCRNVYVNKHIRSYEKISNNNAQKRAKCEIEYMKNPTLCSLCEEPLPYSRKNGKYCNHSCSASHTNLGREVTWNDKIKKSMCERITNNGTQFGKMVCVYCNKISEKKRSKYCSTECKKKFRQKNQSEFTIYKLSAAFKFSLNDYPDEFDFTLVEKHGWYSPINKHNNLNGVSRDHMLSIKNGFDLGIEPSLLAHPANCRLIKHTDNISKNSKSTILLEELLERINVFDLKYGKYQ